MVSHDCNFDCGHKAKTSAEPSTASGGLGGTGQICETVGVLRKQFQIYEHSMSIPVHIITLNFSEKYSLNRQGNYSTV